MGGPLKNGPDPLQEKLCLTAATAYVQFLRLPGIRTFPEFLHVLLSWMHIYKNHKLFVQHLLQSSIALLDEKSDVIKCLPISDVWVFISGSFPPEILK